MASHESGGSPSDMAAPPDGSSAAADTVYTSSSSYAGMASAAASTPACPYRTSTLPDHECARYLDCPEHTLARPDDDNITASAADTGTDANTNPALEVDALDPDAPREKEGSANASTSPAQAVTDTDITDADTNHTLDIDASETDTPPEAESSAIAGPNAAVATPGPESPVAIPSLLETSPPVRLVPHGSETTSSGEPPENSMQQEDGEPEQLEQAGQPAPASEETRASIAEPEAHNRMVDSIAVSAQDGSAIPSEVVDGQSQGIQINSVPTSETPTNPQPELTSAASSRPSSSSSRTSQPPQIRLMDQEFAQREAALEAVAASRQRTPAEFVLPPWQPDSEITQCPICEAAFGFFNRKHHCRKCGRVVCAECSPHRITIPHAYIVRAPGEMTNAQRSVDGLGMAIGGGLRVRLCNPCVPDPNTTPPQSQLQSLNASRFGNRNVRPGHLRSHSSASESVYHDRERTNRERRTDDRYSTDAPSDSWSQDAARSRSATMVCPLFHEDCSHSC
jgi:hypothetical protein